MTSSRENALKILVAESDRIVARDVELILDRNGFVVAGTPRHSSEVMEMVRSTRPDLLLLSVEFESRMGGITLARILKDSQQSLPIVFFTGRSEDQVFQLAREIRPAGYVRKPFSAAELIATVEAAAQRIEPDHYLRDRIPAIRSVANSLDESVIVSGIDGRVVLMNRSAERLTGWREEEASGTLYSQIAPTTHIMRETAANGANGGCPCLITDRKGRQHSVHAITTPVRDDRTELLGTITILKSHHGREDETAPETESALSAEALKIPGRARALQAFEMIVKSKSEDDMESSFNDEALRPKKKSDIPFQPLLDQIGDPMLVFDRNAILTAANQEALDWFKSDHPILGRPLWDLFTPEEVRRYENEFFLPLQTGRVNHFELHDTGRAAWNEVRLYRSHEGVIALFINVTQARLARVEEIRQHRLEGLGLLARGFAHDFNNHLTTVTGNLGLVKKLEKDPELLGMLDEAETASSRAAGLVQQLMTFATGGRPVREPVKVPELLRQVLSDHRMGHPSIRYQFSCSESDIKANVDRAQVRRVAENLINNAEEAMREGGTLSVACHRISAAEAGKFRKDLPSSDDDFLLIEVVDSGVGMDQETLARARDPYFSLRQDANATGIGLTVCESIAKAHDGFIHLESQPGKGTRAAFCVPMGRNLSHVHWEELQRRPQVPSLKKPGEIRDFNRSLYRVLILEDDGPIRRLMGTTLRRAGYQVIETADGKETLSEYRKAQEEKNPIDVVITDLTIEHGMGGIETMRRLKEMNPKVVAIVSSGYSDAAAMANPDAFGYKGVLPKPYSPDALSDAVDRVILDHCAAKPGR